MTILTRPVDAVVRIDGVERGRAPLVDVPLQFSSTQPAHTVEASRLGFSDATLVVNQDYAGNQIILQLKAEMWHVTFNVLPAPGVITIDGKPLAGGNLVSKVDADVDMSVDSSGNPIQHEVVATRPNFQPATRTISRMDHVGVFDLTMQPLRKSLSITSTPPGATITLDGQPLGVTPLQSPMIDFPVDPTTSAFIPKQLHAEKPGFDPIDMAINWDDGKTDYPIVFNALSKTVRFYIDPPDATVSIDGKELSRDDHGIISTSLQFPPINEKGDLKTHTVKVSKKAADSNQQWEIKTFSLGWENGKPDYHLALNPITTQTMELLEPALHHGEQGWEIVPQRSSTVATLSTDEPPGRPVPQMITQLPKGQQLGSLAIAPDGSVIVFNVLSSREHNELRSQLFYIRAEGAGEMQPITDGKSLDLMPAFTPGGDRIIFATNRFGQKMSIAAMATGGTSGITQLTSNATCDLWPVIDADPQPRLFYQSMIDSHPDSRLLMTKMDGSTPTELSSSAAMQPRISPTNDQILFTAVNSTTGRREIFRMSDHGKNVVNLTNSPDIDECDPAWSSDGGKIVFASDHAADEHGQHNYDIWMIDAAKPGQAFQLTASASRDDCPVFDPTGHSVYFRSNRGGVWGIWKIAVK